MSEDQLKGITHLRAPSLKGGGVIFKLLLFLLAGAIINVAVAWGCAMWSTVIAGASADASNDDILEWARLNRLEGAPFEPSITQPAQPYIGNTTVQVRTDGGFGYAVRTQSVITYLNSVRQRWFADHAMTVRAGWPCRSVCGERWEAERGWDRYVVNPQVGANILALPKPEHERHMLSILRPAAQGKGSFRIIPLRPSWPGFAINTVFYAAIVWALFVVPGNIKRRQRIKRNKCGRCAYPLGASSVCSECGTPVKSARNHPQMSRIPQIGKIAGSNPSVSSVSSVEKL